VPNHALIGPDRFPPTSWSTVARAAGGASRPADPDALERLLRRYLRPLRVFLVQGMRVAPDRAEDLLQGFVTDRVLTGSLLPLADSRKGKFRALLKTALQNYVRSARRHDTAQKRAPAAASVVPLPESHGIPAPSQTPAEAFEVAWAREVLAEAIGRTEAHYREMGLRTTWLAFVERFLNPTLHGGTPPPCSDIAARLGLDSAHKVSNAVVTCSRALRQSIRAVVRGYAADEGAVDDEIRELREILRRGGQYGP